MSRFTIFEIITSLYLKDLCAHYFFIIDFSLFTLSCCIINKIYYKMSDSDKAYESSKSLIEKKFNFLIVH